MGKMSIQGWIGTNRINCKIQNNSLKESRDQKIGMQHNEYERQKLVTQFSSKRLMGY